MLLFLSSRELLASEVAGYAVVVADPAGDSGSCSSSWLEAWGGARGDRNQNRRQKREIAASGAQVAGQGKEGQCLTKPS